MSLIYKGKPYKAKPRSYGPVSSHSHVRVILVGNAGIKCELEKWVGENRAIEELQNRF